MTKQIYSDWLCQYCKDHENSFVRESESMVRRSLDLDEKVPNEYGWKFSSRESLEKQISEASSYQDVNSIFWKDQARNVEAYALMTYWRGIELIKSCLSGLNGKEVIAPAISARSLLEISTVFLLNANTLHKTFGELSFPEDTIVTSSELEALVVKMIWGTRYGDPEPYLTQTNIMTSLQRLAKNPKATDLMPNYEFLCDIAHPSFIGNTSYWSHVDSVYPDGSEKRVMSRLSNREFNTEITDKTIWALAWSSACIRNAFEIMSDANRVLLGKLEIS
ncbi:hypothetical protein VXK10_002885 [Vibrio parahaemolyticus]|uniref:hypothetical protein n=1 Tax=Vibrio parahaemolyticus TaxID=670 RepID=UPI00107097B8|nr:hypothetical protein [Vibrio parahaemolyticus]EKD9042298.1 hypothetical protein [Vibrio parahaemolyticus]EKL0189386.1 hypothetical protein [Vibrio parahaemolyticus]ELA7199191.1 hypothetical protein [Vibrio parahaemolyticus]EME0148637.1 hypothetical protein [Vibrio parahaemolyticus]EME0861935.1 hypothetical protein [Vibrio parahaemolyticus]